ncbi:DUF4883 family protein [Clostridium hydrogenum]|uniref:DUF4883 family protein n=1 Tax=Clostridium hydrogenum TaxID=2855764 RepID=UPI001F28567C|nr:DUF4883 family protein [Clostridium hydrogenum]
MKLLKKLLAATLIITCLFTTGCTSIDLLHKTKPCAFYYTNCLLKSFHTEKNVKASLIDTSYYKNHDLTLDEINQTMDFLNKLSKNNFIKKPTNLPSKPLYRMFYSFSNAKYVIDVFNKDYISIYPWDGDFEKDYLNISNIPASCNLYNLCEYAIPR